MKCFFRLSFIRFCSLLFGGLFFSIAILSHPLLAQKGLKEDVERLRGEVEKMELEYWRFKESTLEQRKAISEEIDLTDQRLKTAYERRNSLTEEIFLALENLEKTKSTYEDIRADRESFRATIIEIVDKDAERLKGSHPRLIEDGIRRLSAISDSEDTASLEEMIEKVVAYKQFLLDQSEQVESYVGKIVSEQTKTSTVANVLRLGFIHSSYLAEDGTRGLLLRSSDLEGIHYAWYSQLPETVYDEIEAAIADVGSISDAQKQSVVNFTVPVDVAQAGLRARSLIEGGSTDRTANFVKFFQSGGVLMYPLALVALFSFFIALERLFFFSRVHARKSFKDSKFVDSLSASDYEGAKNILTSGSSLFSEALAPAVSGKLKLEDVEKYVEDGFSRILPKLDARLATLAILGSIAPLIGLLGTVSGMISLFDVITIYGTSNPKVLAGGISIALVTTQTGLSIAIPVLLAHHFFKQQKNKIFERVEQLGLLIVEHQIATTNGGGTSNSGGISTGGGTSSNGGAASVASSSSSKSDGKPKSSRLGGTRKK